MSPTITWVLPLRGSYHYVAPTITCRRGLKYTSPALEIPLLISGFDFHRGFSPVPGRTPETATLIALRE